MPKDSLQDIDFFINLQYTEKKIDKYIEGYNGVLRDYVGILTNPMKTNIDKEERDE